MEIMEEWRDIEGYEGLYQISNLGSVKSLFRYRVCKNGSFQPIKERLLSPRTDKDGYKEVLLCNNCKRKCFKIHRLVAQAFISNPNNYPVINHKDENPSNNIVENLEWCTVKYNTNYGTTQERRRKTRGWAK
jgi:hypothetical protein